MQYDYRPRDSAEIAARKRVLAFLLRFGVFLDHPCIQPYRKKRDEGVFYSHGSASLGEHFCEFLVSVGVLIEEYEGPGLPHLRLALRGDAVDGYTAHLIDRGMPFDAVMRQFVRVGFWHWLPSKREPFPVSKVGRANMCPRPDGHALMADLVTLGYAERVGANYRWTEKLAPLMIEEDYWPGG